jgi:hypothetical protein
MNGFVAGWIASAWKDLRTLRATLGAAGGTAAAWRNAGALLQQRRVLVVTSAPLGSETPVVLRTQILLSGDAQTDVLRAWLPALASTTAQDVVRTHFTAVAAAIGGWAAALALVRTVIRLLIAAGVVLGSADSLERALTVSFHTLGWVLLSDRRLLVALALPLLAVLARWVLRLYLRERFRAGLRAAA